MNTKYLKMIKGMKNDRKREWSVYVLRCGDGSLYTGIAKNIEARIKQHNTGRGSAYVRTRLPAVLAYQENGLTRSRALMREASIKRRSRPDKEKIISNYARHFQN